MQHNMFLFFSSCLLMGEVGGEVDGVLRSLALLL